MVRLEHPSQRVLAFGRGSGSFWQAVPRCAQHFFDSAHWLTAFRQRLGVLVAPPGLTCHLRNAGASEQDEDGFCGHALDPELRHPMIYKVGPARMRPYRALAAACAESLRRAGAVVDLERVWPSLYKWSDGVCTEAVMDLVAWWPGSCNAHLIDVTVRCLHADRYARTCHRAGVPASGGEREKLVRYGTAVTTIAMETYGRMGKASCAALERLASEAGTYGSGPGAAGRLVPGWRLAIERAVLFAQADIVLLALGANALQFTGRLGRGL